MAGLFCTHNLIIRRIFREIFGNFRKGKSLSALFFSDLAIKMLGYPDNKALNPIDFCLIQMFVNP